MAVTTSAYFDFLGQLSGLLRDPAWYGQGIPRGRGEPVLLIPGFIAGDWTLRPMAAWLRRLGHQPFLSGIDLNIGCPQRTVELVGIRLEQIVESAGAPVTIIGHSLGGVLGRALAAAYPQRVGRVIALGSPLRMNWDAVRDEVRPALLAVQALWQTLCNAPANCATDECTCGFAEAARHPNASAQNFNSIFTRADEVVDWRECVAEAGTNHEVRGGHASLIVNKEVYRVVAAILAGGA